MIVCGSFVTKPVSAQTSISPGGVYAGMGAYFIKPVWNTNPAFNAQVPVGGATASVQRDFDYDTDIAPLFFFGASNCASGLGVQGRAWRFEDETDIAGVNSGAVSVDSAGPLGVGGNNSVTAGDALFFGSSLEIDVIDMLGTWALQSNRVTTQFGAGVRYANIEQSYLHFEVPAAAVLVDAIATQHEFEGFGPTIAMENRVPLLGGLSLLADFRASHLFGDSEQVAVQVVDNAVANVGFQNNDAARTIYEMELGGELASQMGRFQVFGQGAFVTQYWQGAGNSANSDLIAPGATDENADKNADLTLYGFRATAGVRF
jgi:hypothetical protein